MCVLVLSIPVSGNTIYLVSSNVSDVGAEVMLELLHCHADSFNDGHLSRQVICVSEGAGTLKGLSWIFESSENFTISGHSASPPLLALCRFVFEPSQSAVRRSGVQTVPSVVKGVHSSELSEGDRGCP